MRFSLVCVCCSTRVTLIYVRLIIFLSVLGVQCSKKVRWSLALEPLMSWSLCHHDSTQSFERFACTSHLCCLISVLLWCPSWTLTRLVEENTGNMSAVYLGVNFVARKEYTASSFYRKSCKRAHVYSFRQGFRFHCFCWISLWCCQRFVLLHLSVSQVPTNVLAVAATYQERYIQSASRQSSWSFASCQTATSSLGELMNQLLRYIARIKAGPRIYQ